MRPVRVQASGEHGFEPERGLPGPLPPDERQVWQGAPDWRLLAVQAYHLRALAAYFVALLVWRAGAVLADGGSAGQALTALLWPLPLAALCLGLVAGIAWLSARTTVYTLTNRRVVMRVGIVLTVTYNLPLTRIESASVRHGRQGSGDLCLLLTAPQRIAYLHLWPHARPWRVARTEPMLRALRDVELPAQLLARSLRDTLAAPQRAAGAANQPGVSGAVLQAAA